MWVAAKSVGERGYHLRYFPTNDCNNWPDAVNNHGAAGMCCAFADGHAEFRSADRNLMEAYMYGHYNPSLTGSFEPGIFAKCHVRRNGTGYEWY